AFFGAMANHFQLPALELEAQLRGKQNPLKPVPKPGESALTQAQAEAARVARERPPDLVEATYVAAGLVDRRLLAKDPFALHAEPLHPGLRALVGAVSSGEPPDDAVHEAPESTRRVLEQARKSVPEGESERETWFLKLCQKLKVRKIED